MTRAYRVLLIGVSLLVAFGFSAVKAPAALDMAVGAREVIKGPVSACNDAAKAALEAVLQNPLEAGETGQWEATTADSVNGTTAGAAIHCYPMGDSYLVTFTCAAQVPPYPDTAGALCTKLNAAFDSHAH